MTKRRRKPDHYYYKAKKEGYRSRAAFKIQQMDQKFGLFRRGQVVLDLCGAPGGWAQVAKEKVGGNGRIILLDLQSVNNLPEVECFRCDITAEETFDLLQELLGDPPAVDLLLADCAPKVTGAWSTDQARQIFLAENALRLAVRLRASQAVTKVFEGRDFAALQQFARTYYKSVRIYKPKASRSESAEIYLYVGDFRGKTLAEGDLDDAGE